MQTQLKTALAGIECDYYNQRYSESHSGNTAKQLTPSHTNKVWNDAVSHNDTTMSKYGWG